MKPGRINYEGREYEKVHVIHNGDPGAGFGALITYALNGARRAEAKNWLPVVEYSQAETPHFYDPDHGDNVWEYYFEPIAGLGSEDLRHMLERGEIERHQLHRYSDAQVLDWHVNDPDRITTFWGPTDVADRAAWMAQKRQLGREYVARYLRVKAAISVRLDTLRQELLRAPVMLGVHIRGTDFAYARPTAIDEYFAAIDAHVEDRKIDEFGIFLATDQSQFVDAFERRYPGRISACDAARSSNAVAPFKMKTVSPYKKGEDVLLDILLLSQCSHVFKSVSAVGEYALWFNPELECTDFALSSEYLPDTNLWTGNYLKLDVDNKGPLRVALLSWARIARLIVGDYWRRLTRVLR